MEFIKGIKTPLLLSAILSVVLLVLSFVLGNNEFLIYAFTIIALVVILHKTDHIFHYNPYALWGFAVWIALHSLGGLATFPSGVRVYDWILLDLVREPYSILKYDQILHFYTYVVIAGLLCSVVDSIVSAKASHTTIGVVVVLAAIGVGGINEIIEFMPVVFFNAPGPGGYHNTLLDLIMNSLGAMLGTVMYYWKK